ncbi:AraC family transcriptional regulator ligand-binding domain-containing protein [Marinobacter sp. chi1]|uniref:AraC family transcriptional regulator ligand-binding domain-containing protein n=1 Tax=Marinobacter suaedae TaxID=3057675 RepID=A0ABT8VZR9_9GAMM|nr:AraC family transcriptional regulator [Marinobacter sp. chi1]MDO3721465.1 AraC family transcriptional regulator ligand-binding domain-containing protein [Marinobacter sp. chi1]
MQTSTATAPDLGMPAIYLHLLAELLGTLGVDEQELLHRVGLNPHRLNSMDLRVSQSQASEFVTRAIIESGEPGLGIMLARELRLPLHGTLGTAVMSSQTLAEALDLMTRFLTLRAPQLEVSRLIKGDNAIYRVHCARDLGPLQGFILDAMLYGCVYMGSQLTGTLVKGCRMERRGPEPGYIHRFRQQIPVPVIYGASDDALIIPVSQLDLPIRFSDDQLAADSRSQCEVALKQLTEDAGFACRVRRVIETSHPFPPKLARVAATLFVSERTLKRRLQEESVSFQALVDQVRLKQACDLLEKTGLNLGQIAETLGYADAANFTRAFKRWTGISPSQHRNESRKPRLREPQHPVAAAL